MTARIHVVAADLKLAQSLSERLSTQLYQVEVSQSGRDVLERGGDRLPDLIILAQQLSDMDAYACTHHLKGTALLSSIPVVLLAERGESSARVNGLQAGIDDFLTLPIDDVELTIRVKSLLRLGTVANEVKERCDTAASMGIRNATPNSGEFLDDPLRVVLITQQDAIADHATRFLKPVADAVLINGDDVLALNSLAHIDLILSTFSGAKELAACQTLRAHAQTRHVPILGIVPADNDSGLQQCSQLGLTDFIRMPLDQSELIARSLMQMRGKRLNDRLRARIGEDDSSIVTDVITGLPNQNYLDSHLSRLIKRAHARSQPLTVSVIGVQDLALPDAASIQLAQSISRLLKTVIRGADLVCRTAPDRFALVMPDTSIVAADSVLERLRTVVQAELQLSPLVLGRAELSEADDSSETLLARALADGLPGDATQIDNTLESCV